MATPITSAPDVDVNIARAGAMGNEFLSALNAIREADPVYWSEASNCWIVTRHVDIIDAMQDKFPLSLDRLPQIAFGHLDEQQAKRDYPNLYHHLSTWIVNLDPPAHTRLRKLLFKSFSHQFVESLRPVVRTRIAQLIELLEQRPQIEFNEDIARRLTGSVILDIIGLPQSKLPRLRDWANAFTEAIGVPHASHAMMMRAEQAMAEINDMLLPELEARRSSPRDDLLTTLSQAREEGDKLSTEEMLGALHVLIVAGHDSTANSLTLSLAALIDHPEAWQQMYQHPEQIGASVQELLRYIAMSAAQPRIVSEDFEWHDKKLKKGELLFLMMAAGNRDPRVYHQPELLDLSRNNRPSLVFGPGVHLCLGHLLAKLQLTEFFSAFVQTVESAELLEDRLEFMEQITFRGVRQLNVRLKLRANSPTPSADATMIG